MGGCFYVAFSIWHDGCMLKVVQNSPQSDLGCLGLSNGPHQVYCCWVSDATGAAGIRAAAHLQAVGYSLPF